MPTGLDPDPITLARRGVAAFQAGRREEAIELLRQAAALGNDAGAYSSLAMVLASIGRFDESIEASRKAISILPEVPELQSNLGNALQMAGQIDQAIIAYQRALALRPNYPDAQANLAHALTTRGRFDEAIALLRQLLESHPGAYAALINLAAAYQGKGDLDGAIDAGRGALAVQPGSPEAHANLALALKDSGRLDEAIDHYRRSLELRPDSSVADALLMLLFYHPGYTDEPIVNEHRAWFGQYVEHQVRPFDHPQSDPATSRRLRIGYVSPDFRAHPVGYNVLPLIQHHDGDRFEIFCYSNVTCPDGLTGRFRNRAHHWGDIRPLDDERAAALIQRDRIDILVDLALHSGQNRLGVFARKPAPIQVTFAGYPGTTGLPTIDYRLSDPYLDPPNQGEGRYCERTIRLPNSFWCYQPLGDEPEIAPLPALTAGFVTFGCLNNFCKVNDAVLDLWARVLVAVPNSRLLMMSKEGSHRARTISILQSRGVNPIHVEFVGPQPRSAYLRTYHRVDVSLDTFPYNGHTTSLDSFWMGVPVVTLIGSSPVGRAGWSQLCNLKLEHLAANDADRFVQASTRLAGNLPALAELRSTLRDRMRASPLSDAPAFAAGVEAVYLAMLARSAAARR